MNNGWGQLNRRWGVHPLLVRLQWDWLFLRESRPAKVIATLGYRLPTDKFGEAPKVCFPKEGVFIRI